MLEAPDAEPALSPALLRLGQWLSAYYGCPLGLALRALLPGALWGGPAVRGSGPQAAVDLSEDMSLEELERRYISILLERFEGHRAKVARVLQISERNLYGKLRAYHLEDAGAGAGARRGSGRHAPAR